MNINMSNAITGSSDAVKLNDAKLLQYSKGVNFGGCLGQVTEVLLLFIGFKEFVYSFLFLPHI